MELTELFTALDNAVQDVKKKQDTFNSVSSDVTSNLNTLRANYDSATQFQTDRVNQANKDLADAIAKARDLQQQLQERTTGFLSDPNRVR